MDATLPTILFLLSLATLIGVAKYRALRKEKRQERYRQDRAKIRSRLE